jgi:hypothetical protein
MCTRGIIFWDPQDVHPQFIISVVCQNYHIDRDRDGGKKDQKCHTTFCIDTILPCHLLSRCNLPVCCFSSYAIKAVLYYFKIWLIYLVKVENSCLCYFSPSLFQINFISIINAVSITLDDIWMIKGLKTLIVCYGLYPVHSSEWFSDICKRNTGYL